MIVRQANDHWLSVVGGALALQDGALTPRSED